MTYRIIAYMEDLDYLVGENIPEEQLEEYLQMLTRKQEYREVRQFDIQLEEEVNDGEVHGSTLV